jgi:cell division protein FtsN
MAARRGKTQARRNQGNSGLPGWAWGVLGLLLGVGLFLAVPRLLKSDGDGFFRPRPNPDAEPAPVAVAEDDVVAPDDADATPGDRAKPKKVKSADDADASPEYDFYTLLPGKEVLLSDAELAATERAETQRAAQHAQNPPAASAQVAVAAATDPAKPASPLPQPVSSGNETAPNPPASVATAAPVAKATTPTPAPTDDTRYLLQAGAFQASGQAEELKAKIAMLGLGARVESASLGGKTVYRVRMGPYGTASDLAEAKRKLASGGLPGLAIKVK